MDRRNIHHRRNILLRLKLIAASMFSMAAPIQNRRCNVALTQRLTALLNQCPRGEQIANMINCHRGTKGLHRSCPRSERHRAPALNNEYATDKWTEKKGMPQLAHHAALALRCPPCALCC